MTLQTEKYRNDARCSYKNSQRLAAAAIIAALTSSKGKAWLSAFRRQSITGARRLIRSFLLVYFSGASAGFLVARTAFEWAYTFTDTEKRTLEGCNSGRPIHIPKQLTPPPLSVRVPAPAHRLPLQIAERILHSIAGFSFSACSWLMFYHIGCARALVDFFGLDLLSAHSNTCTRRSGISFAGASSGSLVAAALATGVSLPAFEQFAFEMVNAAVTRFAGPAGNMSTIVRNGLMQLLPDDSIDRVACPGRLIVSVTSLKDFLPSKRIITSTSLGQTRNELVETLLASCYIPIYYEDPALFWDSPSDNGTSSPNNSNKRIRVVGLDGGLVDGCPPAGSPDDGIGGKDLPTVRISPYASWVKHRNGLYIAPLPAPCDDATAVGPVSSRQPSIMKRVGNGFMQSDIIESEQLFCSEEEANDGENEKQQLLAMQQQQSPLYPRRLAFFPTKPSDYEAMLLDGYNDTAKWILSAASEFDYSP